MMYKYVVIKKGKKEGKGIGIYGHGETYLEAVKPFFDGGCSPYSIEWPYLCTECTDRLYEAVVQNGGQQQEYVLFNNGWWSTLADIPS